VPDDEAISEQNTTMTDSNADTPLERKAYQDLDTIAELADAGVVAIQIGDYDGAEDVLEQIEGIAEAWKIPECDKKE
jgi:hypothetical protein